MKKLTWLWMAAAVLFCQVVGATTPWSVQDYDLYSGDFDGDGIADLLYVAKAPGNLSGIARGVTGSGEEPLTVSPDGRIFQGNTRMLILEERGFDTSTLDYKVYVPQSLGDF
jgi:hypothetical protein